MVYCQLCTIYGKFLVTRSSYRMDFPNWLSKTTEVFKRLPSAKQRETLDALTEACGPRLLFEWHADLELMLKRDFLVLLPEEVAQKILGYLNPWILFICEQVQWVYLHSFSVYYWRMSYKLMPLKKHLSS